MVIRVPIELHVPPDLSAIKYWLEHRDPKNWSDRKKTSVDSEFVAPRITSATTQAEAMKTFRAVLDGARYDDFEGETAVDEETAGRFPPLREATEPTPASPIGTPNGQVRPVGARLRRAN